MTGAAEKSRLLLVDFENVQQVDLKRLDDSYRIVIFVGTNQRSVPIDLVTNAQELGGRVEWQRIGGEGRNALDFFIAYYLGRVMEWAPKPESIVLSKDRGFDPLLKYLNAAGLKCRRINSLGELHAGHAVVAGKAQPPKSEARGGAPEDKHVLRVVELLRKLDKKARPRKRRTLSQSISAMFQKRLSKLEVDRTIEAMLAMKLISESNGVITYEF